MYYVVDDDDGKPQLMEVAFDVSEGRPVLGTPTVRFSPGDGAVAIAPDGRLVLIDRVEPEEGEDAPDATGVILVENWLSRFTE